MAQAPRKLRTRKAAAGPSKAQHSVTNLWGGDAWDLDSVAARREWHEAAENRQFTEWCLFEDVRAAIAQRRKRSRTGRVVLDPELAERTAHALFRAQQLTKGWAFGEALQARFEYACQALETTVDGKKRARVFLNRMLGRPDRSRGRGKEYGRDELRVVQAFLDLTSGVIRRPSFDVFGGINWQQRGVKLPVSPDDAIQMLCKEFGVKPETCRKYLERRGIEGLRKRQRDK